MKRYNPTEIEQKWQAQWEAEGTYAVNLHDTARPKYYSLSMLPGITGAGIHIGHGRTFQFADIKARFKRQQGYNTYHPIGWDSFGLPVENYAIKVGKTPRVAHDEAKAHFIAQLKRLGFSYDWTKEISTADPEYYKWTQWIFTQLYKHDLAYQKEQPQWWCDTDNTVLANEQVEGGKCWRCGNPVSKRNLKQWFFRITAYADEILEATDDLDWTEMVKTMQKNWIGRSVGAEVEFMLDLKPADSLKFTSELTKQIMAGSKTSTIRYEAKNLQTGDIVELMTRDGEAVSSFGYAKITNVRQLPLRDIPNDLPGHCFYNNDAAKLADFQRFYGEQVTLGDMFTIYDFVYLPPIAVFTTRPDTLFGASYVALAPEHPLVAHLTNSDTRAAVEAYVAQAAAKSDVERQENKDKTGVFTGSYAINPVNGQKVPIWVADYVLSGYGTGAVMAVPAHDERDLEFAEKFDLPIKQVIADYKVSTGDNAPRGDWSTREKEVVDAIITDGEGNYLLQVERNANGEEDIHFVGGGVEEDDASVESAVRREVLEEVGYSEIISVKQAAPYDAVYAQRAAKQRNHRTWGAFYEVVVNRSVQVKSEIDDGLHDVMWVKKSEVEQKISPEEGWGHHLKAWRHYLAGKTIDTDVREGVLVNSGVFDGTATSDAREQVVAWLERQGLGRSKTTYKMRDWLISRQRYWGAPIPIVHVEGHAPIAVADECLPVILPEVENFKPTGGNTSVLAQVDDWVRVWVNTETGQTASITEPKPEGDAWVEGRRETDTLDGYACSSWYFLRYLDPHNDSQAWDPEIIKHWAPVDYYNGADHAVAHLLYSRFWMRFFHKLGLVPTPEPFKRMMYNAYIMAPDGQKMSKSKGNVIDPMEIMDSGYGADALRVYEMFIAPYDMDAPWDTRGVPGTYRFLNRVWNVVQEFAEATAVTSESEDFAFPAKRGQERQLNQLAAERSEEADGDEVASPLLRLTHATIKKVTRDIEDEKFNTAVAAMMEMVNGLYKLKDAHGFANEEAWRFALESLLQILAPFAPHLTEELWHELGHTDSIHVDHWPKWDEAYLAADTMTIIVQVNGKLRAKLELPADTDQAAVEAAALADEHVARFVTGTPRKVIYLPGKLVNIVV